MAISAVAITVCAVQLNWIRFRHDLIASFLRSSEANLSTLEQTRDQLIIETDRLERSGTAAHPREVVDIASRLERTREALRREAKLTSEFRQTLAKSPSNVATCIVAICLLAFVEIGLIPLLINARRELRETKGHCGVCNFNLTGNRSRRCPECGTCVPGAPSSDVTQPR
jgi:hypothetical protein